MEIIITTRFNATAQQIYNAWLSSEEHSKMTGGEAEVNDIIGDNFKAWNDYISGRNIELVKNLKIVQSWRTVQFEDEEEDSQIEILLHEQNGETELTLNHTNVPESGEHYRKGWETSYFEPMRKYFKQHN